jgi:hypothetical protein
MQLSTGGVLIVLECVLFLLPFDFFMEQLHCSELLDEMLYNVYSMFSTVWIFLVYEFIHFSRFCIWFRCVFD